MRRARRYARRNGLEWRFDPARGKGSHGRFFIGELYTAVQHGEIATGTLRGMLRDLNIDPRRF
ncbi:MAG: hypothetical protein F4W95_04690 [Chloroflexi bacterium]|nr:hypothetical protein [Chloroflexota bacterium]MYD47769.1 hypothetical protein [Chloroflexota bacterium]